MVCAIFISACVWMFKYPVWMSVCVMGGERDLLAMVMKRSDVEQLSVKLTCVSMLPMNPFSVGRSK